MNSSPVAQSGAPESYLYQRQLPVESGYDLVVAGGGPAGTAAAVCAARLGAKVLLIEATGTLGGMGTSALVSAWSDTSDGERMLFGGFAAESIKAMFERGYLRPGFEYDRLRTTLHGGFGFNAEGLKRVLDDACLGSGVEVRFFTRVIDVDYSGRKIDGLVVANIEGNRYIRTRAVIDATGDAFVAQACGVGCRQAGRDTEHIMAPTLCSVQTGVDFKRFNKKAEQGLVFKAIADGFFSQPDRHVPGLFQTGPTTGILNAGHLFGTDALNCRSLSDGMMWGRRLAEEYTRFYRQYFEGCEKIEYVTSGSLMGVRESRRIVGEYELNYADFMARRSFPDQIAIYNKSVDIHVHDCSDEQWERYTREFLAVDRPAFGEYYGIPYGILVPRQWTNLWVAGRCTSSDVKVHGAIRDQPACIMMGEAAGTAVVQSLRTGQPACDLNTASLVETLRAHHAVLPQERLSPQMTRG